MVNRNYYTISTKFISTEDTLCSLKTCLEGNEGLIQLRYKELNLEDLELLVLKPILAEIKEEKLKRIILNASTLDSLEYLLNLVKKYELGGLHLTSSLAQQIVQENTEQFTNELNRANIKLIISCHDEAEIEIANQFKLSFITLSPVKPSSSCPNDKTLGWSQFHYLTKKSIHPVYALGGLSAADYDVCIINGGAGIAAINAFWNLREY